MNSKHRPGIFAVAAGMAAAIVFSSCDDGGKAPEPSVAIEVFFEKETYTIAPSRAADICLSLSEPAGQFVRIPISLGGDAVEGEDFELSRSDFAVRKGEDKAFVSIRNLNHGTTDRQLTISLGTMPEGVTAGSAESTSVTITHANETSGPDHFFIDNGEVCLGIDMNGGGSVFYFAESATGRNLLNHADKGRYMQQSFYGDPDGSTWSGQPWVWNPVQGGGSDNTPATIRRYEFTETSIWVQTMPKLWASSVDEPNVVMEEEISLRGRVATVSYRFRYSGSHNHGARTQELPAFFCDLALRNLVAYDGDKPWTDAPTYSIQPGWPNESHYTTEHWAAYVDASQWGIGLYFPNPEQRMEMTTYGHQGPTGPSGGGCSYFAPIKVLTISSGFEYSYDVYMTIGSVADIRGRFKAIRDENNL